MIEWIVSSSILIAVIATLRYILKGKISLRLQYALWALVLLRLLVPLSFGSTQFSILNALKPVTQDSKSIVSAVVGYTGVKVPDFAIAQPNPNFTHGEQASQYEVNRQEWESEMDGAKVETGTPITVSSILLTSWIIGIAVVGAALLACNLRFAARLKKSRRALNFPESTLPVYISDAIETPCLFGLFRPTIYVTPEAAGSEVVLRHVLTHEMTHFRHGDNIWSVLRGVCLALHWYNPLVWLSAVLSRRDAELACDEATIMRIGESERAEYGRTLIGMTCQKRTALLVTATTMTGSRSSIKERILLIAKKPKTAIYTLIAVVLISAVAVGCTFTGAETQTDTPWAWAQGLTAEDIGSATPLSGNAELSELSDDETAQLLSLLGALTQPDFTLNEENAGITPEYGLTIVCGDETYYINQANAAASELEMSYANEQWQINSPKLHSFIVSAVSSRSTELPSEPEGPIPLVAVTSSGETAEPYYHFTAERTWTDNGWLYADGMAMSAQLLDEASGKIPTLKSGRDFSVSFADNVNLSSNLTVYNTSFEPVHPDDRYYYGFTALNWLPEGEYYCVFGVYATGEHIESQQESEYEIYECVFRLVVDESQVPAPYAPGEIHDLVSAELRMNGWAITVDDARALAYLEEHLGSATDYGSSGCPFTSTLYLTRSDGKIYALCPAEDSCDKIFSDGLYFDYNAGDSTQFWSLFYSDIIHATVSESFDAAMQGEYVMYYIDWSRYSLRFGSDDTIELLEMLRDWVLTSDGTMSSRFHALMYLTRGLDGAYADYYSSILSDAFELDKAEFAWECLGNASDEAERTVINMLAYAWDVTPEAARQTLESHLPT